MRKTIHSFVKILLFACIFGIGCFTASKDVHATYAIDSQITVKYDANGGTGAPSYQYSYDSSITLSSTVPTRSYYEFLGWAESADSNKAVFQPGQVVYPDEFGQDYVLYAVWKPMEFTITYDTNGGTEANFTEKTTYSYGLTITSTVPNRPRYRFLGWATKADATSATYKTSTYYEDDIKKDTTLYAVWSLTSYTVTYSSYGATNMPEAQTKYYNENLVLSTLVPEKENYTFTGWKATSGTIYQPGEVFAENNKTTLSAQWVKTTYTITYDANGGVDAPAAQTKTSGIDLTLSSKEPYMPDEGGIFLGWATTKDAYRATFYSGDKFTQERSVTLYAVWDMNQYTVNFDDNGGYYGPVTDTKIHGTALIIPNVTPEREGYTFLGWATSDTATTPEYKIGDSYTTEGNNKTLYAVWQKGTVSSGITDGSSTGTGGNNGTITDANGNTIANPSTPTSQTITASNQSIVYKKNKKVTLKVSTNGGGALTYKTSNKKVVAVNKTTGKLTIKGYGKATITITAAANGNYLETTKKITVTITPKKVTLKSAKSPSKKTLSATWKKEAAASGYLVQFSPSKKFKVDTFQRKYGKSKTSMKLFGLKSKKTFYVRVCAYKTVKGKKICGPWSNAKQVKIK